MPNINQATYATYNYSGVGCVIDGAPTYSASCFTQGPIPYPAYSGDQIYVLKSAANSNYNALQSSFVRRFAGGLTANVNYTWSHILNNGSPQGEGGNRPVECVRDGCVMDLGNGTPIPVNSFQQYDYGNADLDVRQRFAAMLDYTLPFGRSLQGAPAYLFKGWSVNAIYAYSTGLPISVSEQGGGPPGLSSMPAASWASEVAMLRTRLATPNRAMSIGSKSGSTLPHSPCKRRDCWAMRGVTVFTVHRRGIWTFLSPRPSRSIGARCCSSGQNPLT